MVDTDNRDAPTARSPWKRALSAILVAVVASCAAYFVVAVRRARADARRVICVHNLKLLSMCLRRYAEAHDGAMPDSWAVIVADPAMGFTDLEYLNEVLLCPEFRRRAKRKDGEPYRITGPENVDALSTYVLIPGIRLTDDPHTVVAYERGDHHGGRGHSVLHLEGSAWWIPVEEQPIPEWSGPP